jgi:hypothetical protein
VTGSLQQKIEVEPLTNYFVGRVQRELGQRGAIGFLTTAVNRDLRTNDLTDLLPNRALVAGADAHYYFDSKKDWVLTGSLASSYVTGSSGAISKLETAPQHYFQRPDAPHLAFDPGATSLSGWTGSVNLNRNNGVHGFNAALWAVSPGFESGDAGFSFNSDRAGAHAVYQWHSPKVNRLARDRMIAVAKWYTWNYGHELQGDGAHLFGRIQFKNYWSLFASTYYFRRTQDDRSTRGGPSMLGPSLHGGFLDLATDTRKRLSFEINASGEGNEYGAANFNTGVSVRYRPMASLDISTGPAYLHNNALAQYVGTFVDPVAAPTFGSRYVFGTLNQKEFSLQTRVNYVLSPKTSFQLYMQPLVSVGAYGSFKELAQPHTFDFTVYGQDRGLIAYDPATQLYLVGPGDGGTPFSFTNPDFNFKSLRLNAILRWEWRPGSAMYFVWTEQRQDDTSPGQFAFGRDVRRTFAAPADDVILFKIAYWFQR